MVKDGGGLEVYLPRFRIEWKRELNDDLQQLGMRSAFFRADFTRMSLGGTTWSLLGSAKKLR